MDRDLNVIHLEMRPTWEGLMAHPTFLCRKKAERNNWLIFKRKSQVKTLILPVLRGPCNTATMVIFAVCQTGTVVSFCIQHYLHNLA